MDDLEFGTRDRRGNWAPDKTLEVAPFWDGKFGQMGTFIKGFFWPWNAFHMATALFYWLLIIPDIEVLKSLSWGWSLRLLAANLIGIFLMYGAIELFYYFKRILGQRFKVNPRFPGEHPSEVFWFRSQNLDNFLRSFLIGIPIWTAVEVLVLWCFANSWGTWLDWAANWPWLIVLTLLVPAIHEVHFFCIHRLIHTPWLYKWVHSVHHNSINPSPWSSLSMHPVEHLLYFGEIFWHLLIPTHPVVMIFNSHVVGYGAINGHIGFDKLELTDSTLLDSHAYAHYLHHKYFEVNYGGDGLIPLDKWFGCWHDGSQEAHERMKVRFRRKKQRKRSPSAGKS